MSEIVLALGRACRSLLHPRMWLLMIWPGALATLFWGVMLMLGGSRLLGALQTWLSGFDLYRDAVQLWPLSLIATALGYVLLLSVFVPLVLITASLIIGVFSMPMIVALVAGRHYPGLARQAGGSLAGSLGNALWSCAGLAGLALLSLPLWVIPLLWPLIPVALFGWFNQRLFRYDALAEHASADELRLLTDRHAGHYLLLGVILALIGHIPVLGFFMPVLGGLAFKKNPLKMILGGSFHLSDRAWAVLAVRYGLFWWACAIANEVVRRTQSDIVWGYFRVAVIVVAVIFALAQTPFLLKHNQPPEAAGVPEPPDPGF
jgi:hypothetical protein